MSVAGFVSVVSGIAITFGPGWACIVGGLVLFVAGGLDDARRRSQ